MSTIDWPVGQSQTYVLVTSDGNVQLDEDHETGRRSAVLAPADARRLAAAHRQVADALDLAADHISGTLRISATLAVLERALAVPPPGRDEQHVADTLAAVRAMVDEARASEATPPVS